MSRTPPRTFKGSKRGLSKEELQQGDELAGYRGQGKPKVRSQCLGGARPCPFVSCRYNLYLDVRPIARGTTIRLNFPDMAGPEEMAESCALDETRHGGMTLEDVGQRLNITRERTRQLEAQILLKLKARGKEFQQLVEAWEWSLERDQGGSFDDFAPMGD